jgi:hypothetical protein
LRDFFFYTLPAFLVKEKEAAPSWQTPSGKTRFEKLPSSL